jgi:hypothetical protein
MRDRQKLSLFCALSKQKLFGPFLFAEHTVTSIMYLDMLGEIPQAFFKEDGPDDILFQQEGVPPHVH